MGNLIRILQNTIGQKAAAGLFGLGLCFFVLVHAAGNLLILKGPEAYNGYARALHQFFLFTILEIGLLIFFAGHIALTILLSVKNRAARPKKPQAKAQGAKKTSFAERALPLQGAALLIFLILHLLTFKFGPYYETAGDGESARDIYRLVAEIFQKKTYVAGYILALFILFHHLSHGLAASFKSLGFSHPQYTPLIEKFSRIFAYGIFLGFSIPPLYIFFFIR